MAICKWFAIHSDTKSTYTHTGYWNIICTKRNFSCRKLLYNNCCQKLGFVKHC